MPVWEEGQRVWRAYRDIDTSSTGAFPYEDVLGPAVDPFREIAVEALAAGVGRVGRIGDADAPLFEAEPLVRLGIRWLEERFAR